MNICSINLERAYDCRLSSPNIAPAALLAGALGSSLVGSLFNIGSQISANNANADSVRAANASSERIADANNKTQIQLSRENRDWQEDMYAKSLFDSRQTMEIQHMLNSPGRAVEEMRAAGINPSLGFGNTQATQIASPSVPSASGSGVSLSSPQMMAAHYEALRFPEMASSFGEIARGMSALAEAKKQGVETKQLEATFNDFVEKYHADTDFAKVAASLQTKFAEDQKIKELALLDKQILEKTETIHNLVANHDFIEAQKVLTELKQETERQSKRLSSEQADYWNKKNDSYYQELDAYIRNVESSTASNYSNASLNNERASQLKDMHDDLVKMQEWLTKKAESDYKLSDMDKRAMEKAFDTKCKYLRDHYSNANTLEKKQIDLAIEAVETARKNNDYYHYNMALKTLQSTVGLLQGFKSPQGYTKERQYTDDNGSFVEDYTPWND